MSVTRETLRLQAQLRAEVDAVADTVVRDLVAAWAEAWDEVAVDLDLAIRVLLADAEGKRITKAMIMRAVRLTRALRIIQARLETLAAEAGVRITADLAAVVAAAEAGQAAVTATQLPDDLVDVLGWARVDDRVLDAIVVRSTQQITALTKPLSADATRAVRRELFRGVAAGSNPRVVARRMLARTEGAFNGGLARAATIARTEILDAHREAALVAREANADVLTGWVWQAELSTRTCAACWAMDGTRFDVTVRGPDGHQNCRCTALPVTKSWAELGIEGVDEPRSIRPVASTTFGALTVADQRAILGPARFAAWQAGDYPMDSWAAVRRTTGWRDSVGVSPVPQRSSRRGSSRALAS